MNNHSELTDIVDLATRLLNGQPDGGRPSQKDLKNLMGRLGTLLGITEQDKFDPKRVCISTLVGPAGALYREAGMISESDDLPEDPKELRFYLLPAISAFAAAVRDAIDVKI
jgi:hypothetical protein